MLSNTENATLKTFANADPTAAGFIASGDDQALANWFNANAPGPVKAWRESVQKNEIFEATNITKFDSLTAGKRAAWQLLLDNAPINFSRNKMRAAVDDVWGATDAAAILPDFTENATRAEVALGGNNATNSTVTALRRNWTGTLSAADASLVRVA